MISEKKKWLKYTYFNRNPGFRLNEVHLFSPVKKGIVGMKRILFPTMVVDISKENFTDEWSKSTRYKINRAKKEMLIIKRNMDLLPAILNLFQRTAQLKNLRGYSMIDFDSRPWIECSAVFFEDKMLAGHVWLIEKAEKRCLLFVNASDHHEASNDSSLVGRAHYFLLWKDGLYFRNKEFRTLDLNGYLEHSEDLNLKGVYAWKEGTHGQVENLYQYYPFHVYWLRKFRNMAAR
ncbi:MAG: hypothetical protein ABJC12_08420 [Saprospiraceae bacterium]